MPRGILSRLAILGTLLVSQLACAAVTDKELQQAIQRAGDNAPALEAALDQVPTDQKQGMRFLIAYMPERDLKGLTAEFLLDQTRWTYKVFNQAPWKNRIPEAVFLNDVLPYVSINERRDNWRADFVRRFGPLVSKAQTPSQAAAILNRSIFGLTKVRYSTKRPKADQSPYESIEAGLASCTGLSVLLVDACRAVGVPARFVGTPLWADKSGNHSWVEIYDEGWHFTGAAEPTGEHLDRAWFLGRASKARAQDRLSAIYATSFKPTGQSFPLVWAQSVQYVNAVNVTARYTPKTAAPGTPDKAVSAGAIASLAVWLKQTTKDRPPLTKQDFSRAPLTKQDAAQAQRQLWTDHVARIRKQRAAEMKARVLTHGKLKMPFHYSIHGKKPPTGRSLYISLHGGGGAPKQVNDSQWENQKRLYRPAEGVYLAPRAPTNTWNLWHQGHIDPLFDRLIENLIVFEDVDPDRVYLMGYSAGGDGVYQVAPRMADRLAAASMMAGHPNEASPLGLRNIAFTIHVGERDSAYNRNKVAASWGERLAALHKSDPNGYVNWVKIYPNKGHWLDRLDAAAVPWMAKYRRRTRPERVVWHQDDVTHARFYWLAVDAQNRRGRARVTAKCDKQTIHVESTDLKKLRIRLDDQLVNLDKPVRVVSGKTELFSGRAPRTIGVIGATLAERGDPRGIYSAEIDVDLVKPAQP